jgi:hypothetical protein
MFIGYCVVERDRVSADSTNNKSVHKYFTEQIQMQIQSISKSINFRVCDQHDQYRSCMTYAYVRRKETTSDQCLLSLLDWILKLSA